MRLSMGIGAIVALQVGLQACTPSTNVPGTELYIEAADGKYHGPMESLLISPDAASIEVSVTQQFKAMGVFEDGTQVDVTTDVYWTVDNEGVLSKADFEGGALPLTGRSEGTAAIGVLLGDLNASVNATVIPAALTELALTAEDSTLGRGSSYSFPVTGTYRDGTTKDLSSEAVFASSNEAVLQINGDRVKAVEVGQATLTVTVGEMSATKDFTVECRYPESAPRFIQHYETMPNLRWETAINENGETEVLDFEEVHCGAAWEDTKSFVVIVSTEWCPYCPDRMRWIESLQPAFSQYGMKVLIVEAQDRQGRANMTSAKSAAHIDTIVPNMAGLRLGDLDSKPTQNIFNTSPQFINAFPTVFVFRTSDMKIVANQNDGNNLLDLVKIAEHPEWNWRNPDAPVESFVSNCQPGDEESYEPNDVPSEAPEVGVLATSGGICAEGPDYYRVNLPGRYRVTMTFEHAVGDLDVYIWNEQANAPLQQSREAVGGYSTNNNESFEWEGPALLRVEGKGSDSAPYTLYIEEI